jgi:hypothetical protein
MDTFTIHADNVNVEEIMQEIHRRVLEKKQAGIYSDEELQRISDLKNDLSPKNNERYSELNLYLRKQHMTWELAGSSAMISSHRKIIGPIMVAMKRIGFKLLKFFGSVFFERQTEFNAANVRFNTTVLQELTRLSEDNKQLLRTQEELVRQIELLHAHKKENE